MNTDPLDWLLHSDEPWTRYRALLDLTGSSPDSSEAGDARREMLQHPGVRGLLATAGTWGENPIKRHNDAAHALHAIAVLADFGLQRSDPGMEALAGKILTHRSPEGVLQSPVNIPAAFGGDDTDRWTWMMCDAPVLLYSLLCLDPESAPSLQPAAVHLAGLASANGWRCVCDPALGKFRGPGRREDPCPVANLIALKALSLLPELHNHPAVRAGAGMLLAHWEQRREKKYYLFGMGTDFLKLKYPFIWYDLLHVVEVLSRLPAVHDDPRFREMLALLCAQAGVDGRYTAGSMYQSWKGWSFADKKQPSPWLTLLVLRICARVRGELP